VTVRGSFGVGVGVGVELLKIDTDSDPDTDKSRSFIRDSNESQARRQESGDRNQSMARGWESKSVEIQIEDASSTANSDDEKARGTQDVQLGYKREGMMLQRARILQEMESARNPRYIKMLEEMLNHLESELQTLPPEKIVNRQ
jgi:hypothetical protein